MALHTLSDFANMCGITTAALSVNKTRGKVVYKLIGKKDFIDDTIEPNKSFLEKWKGKKAEQKIIATIPPNPNPDEQPVVTVNPAPELFNTQPTLAFPEKKSLAQLEYEQKEQNLEKTKKETILLELRQQKLEGLLVPVEPVKAVIAQFAKAITSSFNQGADKLLIEFATARQLSSEETAKIRGQITEITNAAITDAVKIAKKSISHIVNEYSENRSRGEKK